MIVISNIFIIKNLIGELAYKETQEADSQESILTLALITNFV